MSMIVPLIFILLYGIKSSHQGYKTRAHMSIVDVWNNVTDNVIIAHGVNSWPALLEQLKEPILETSVIIEGDVLLYKQRKHKNRAIPLMSVPQHVADRITFKEWLKEVMKLGKVIKINVRSTDAIQPVMQYLFAANSEIKSPVILHANVLRSPRSSERPVDAIEFVDGTRRYFPEATLSLGWTRNNVSELTIAQRRISWSNLFRLFPLIKQVEQAIMISARLSVVVNSATQLAFILGIRPEISLLVWSDESDTVNNWMDLIELRSGPYSKQIVFDLHPRHAVILRALPYRMNCVQSSFDRARWHRIEFPVPTTIISGIIESNEGVAFIGWSNSFLISTLRPQKYPDVQVISSKIMFVRKRHKEKGDWLNESGLSIYLQEKVLDIHSPNITGGIEVFLGYNGRLWIKNRDGSIPKYLQKSVGQLWAEYCYEFQIKDRGWRIDLAVFGTGCASNEVYSHVKISLEVPITKSRQWRNVIISKVSRLGIDVLLQNLHHNSSNHFPLTLPLLVIAANCLRFLILEKYLHGIFC